MTMFLAALLVGDLIFSPLFVFNAVMGVKPFYAFLGAIFWPLGLGIFLQRVSS